MADVFNWIPTVAQSTGAATLKVREAAFGDGYTQRASDGINNRSSTFSLQFIDDAATITAIMAFLDAHAGGTAFLWTPPLRDQLLFVCKTYSEPTLDGPAYTITAQFEQTFAP